MTTQRTVLSTQRVPTDITPATFAFDLLFNAAQSIHRAHETTPSTYALPLWKTHVSYLLTAITHGANELAHTELPSLLTLQQDVNNLALHLTSLLAPTFNNPLPTPPTPSTPKPRTTPPTPHLNNVPKHSIRPTPKKPEPRLHWVPNRPETPPRTPSPPHTPPRTPSPTPSHHSVNSVNTVDFLLEPPLYDHPIGPLEQPLYDQPAGPMEGPIYDRPADPMEGPIYPYPIGPRPWTNTSLPPPHPLIPTRSITLQINNVLRRLTPQCEPMNPYDLQLNWFNDVLYPTDFFIHLQRLNVRDTQRIRWSGFNWIHPDTPKIRSSITINFCDDDSYVITSAVEKSLRTLQSFAKKRDTFNYQITSEILTDTPLSEASSSAS